MAFGCYGELVCVPTLDDALNLLICGGFGCYDEFSCLLVSFLSTSKQEMKVRVTRKA